MKNAINSHAGMPHSKILRNPGLYTASTRTTARKNQIMGNSRPRGRMRSISHLLPSVQNGVTL